jgi:hypothetical protein
MLGGHLPTLGASGCLVRPITAISSKQPVPYVKRYVIKSFLLALLSSLCTQNIPLPTIHSTLTLTYAAQRQTQAGSFSTSAGTRLQKKISGLSPLLPLIWPGPLAPTPPLEGRHSSPKPPSAPAPRTRQGVPECAPHRHAPHTARTSKRANRARRMIFIAHWRSTGTGARKGHSKNNCRALGWLVGSSEAIKAPGGVRL